MEYPLEKLEQDILDAIGFYRGLVLDSVEQEMGLNDERWKFVRGRLLKCFGDRGLQGKVTEGFVRHRQRLVNTNLEGWNGNKHK